MRTSDEQDTQENSGHPDKTNDKTKNHTNKPAAKPNSEDECHQVHPTIDLPQRAPTLDSTAPMSLDSDDEH